MLPLRSIPVSVAGKGSSSILPVSVAITCAKFSSMSASLSKLLVQIVATTKVNLKTLDCVLQHLHVVKHVVKGDNSCLYHSISYQAGFIPSNSRGDEKISSQLRNLVSHMMWHHPDVHKESGMPFCSG